MKNQLREILVGSIFAIGFNYLNQLLTWSFESYFHAMLSFIIYSILYLGLLIYFSPKLISLFKRISINPKVVNKENQIHKYFKFFKTITLGVIFLSFFSIFILSALQFLNYSHFKKALQNRQATQQVNSYIENIESVDSNYYIINNLLGNYSDDETNAFAINLQDSFNEEIKSSKLPILMLKNKSDEFIDSLISKSEAIYVIRGTYLNGYADINIEKKTKVNFLQLMGISPLDSIFLKNQELDSIFSDEKFNKVVTEPNPVIYDSDNKTLSKYNLKIGVPNEINYIIYLTLAELISRDVATSFLTLDLNNKGQKDTLQKKINFGLSLLKLANESIPLEVDYFNIKPKIRKRLNPNELYCLQLILNTNKIKLIVDQLRIDYISINDIKTANNLIKISEYYFNQLPVSINFSTEIEYVNSIKFYQGKILFLETKQALNNKILSKEINSLSLLIDPNSNKKQIDLGFLKGTGKKVLTKVKIEAIIKKYDEILQIAKYSEQLILESLRHNKKTINVIENNKNVPLLRGKYLRMSNQIQNQMNKNLSGIRFSIEMMKLGKKQMELEKKKRK